MALNLPKLNLPKLALPSLALDKKRLPLLVGGIVVVAAGGWFGWQYLMEEPPPPPPPPKPAVVPKKLSPAEIAQAREKLVADVLAATGLRDQLERLPQQLAAGVKGDVRDAKKRANARASAAKEALAQMLAEQDFLGALVEDLKKNGDEKQLQAALKEFSAPTGKRALELSRATHTPDELAKFAQAPAGAPERTALLKRIDAATRGGDFAVEAASATLKALAPALAGDNEKRSAALQTAIDKQLAASEAKVRADALTNMAFAFKDASDAELDKFAALYETPASKWLFARLYDMSLEQMKAAADKAVAEMAKIEAATKPALARTAAHKPGGDARRCLELASNTEIIRCAEAYR